MLFFSSYHRTSSFPLFLRLSAAPEFDETFAVAPRTFALFRPVLHPPPLTPPAATYVSFLISPRPYCRSVTRRYSPRGLVHSTLYDVAALVIVVGPATLKFRKEASTRVLRTFLRHLPPRAPARGRNSAEHRTSSSSSSSSEMFRSEASRPSSFPVAPRNENDSSLVPASA